MAERELLHPGEVAALFSVDPRTVARWAEQGLLPDGAVVRTPGGHRRYRADAVRQLLDEGYDRENG